MSTWFPTRKASKLTITCFQLAGWWPYDRLQLAGCWHSPASWKQTNISFEAFLVGNQGWRIKGQMLRYLMSYPKNIFRSLDLRSQISKRIMWIISKSHRKNFFFDIFAIHSSRLYIPTVKQKQSHIKKYLCFIWSPKLLANYVLFSFQTYLIIFEFFQLHLKFIKTFSAWKYLLYPFPSPFLVYFYIIGYNFVMHARIFMFNFDSFLSQKRIQTAGLSKYFVNYTKYIMACTLRSKSLCSRIWIVIPRQ